MFWRKVKASVKVFSPRSVRKLITYRNLSVILGFTLLLNIFANTRVAIDVSEQVRFTRQVYETENPIQSQDTSVTDRQSDTADLDLSFNLSDPFNGFAKAAWARRMCSQNVTSNFPRADKLTVRVTTDRAAVYCPTYKIASTFWRRVFMTNADRRYSMIRNPYAVPADKELAAHLIKPEIVASRFEFKFTFVRNPYTRLYSLYVDKLIGPNSYFWKAIAKKVLSFNRPKIPISCRNEATFPEFIKFVINSLETNKNVDAHFVPMVTNCLPCTVNYSFIGSIESFASDSDIALRKMKLTETADFLQRNGSNLSDEDSIRDIIAQYFASLKKHYSKCMPMHESLKTLWKRLQTKGLIGDGPLTLDMKKKTPYTQQEIVQLAFRSRADSDKDTRKAYVKKNYYESWRQVPKDDLEKIPVVYKNDFLIFNYDMYPGDIFENNVNK